MNVFVLILTLGTNFYPVSAFSTLQGCQARADWWKQTVLIPFHSECVELAVDPSVPHKEPPP